MSVHKKLMQVRCDLMRTKLEKSGLNKFAGYKYFEMGDFMPATMDLFHKHGLCGVVSYTHEYATLQITDVEDGTMIVVTSPMATAQLKGAHDIQNLGAVESYQRRYLWMTALELTETDPIDSAPPMVTEVPKPITKSAEAYAKEKKESKNNIPIEDPFAIHIKIKEGGATVEEFVQILMDATKLQLQNAHTVDDVLKIYQVNRKIYDELKEKDARAHVQVLGIFKEAKDNLTKE